MKDTDMDVITFLTRQHAEIRQLMDEVVTSKGAAQQDVFHHLVRLLAIHETAEEELVHPYVRKTIAGGERIVDQRLQEENSAKELLIQLDEMGTENPDFLKYFDELRTDVLAHAEAEEKYEFAKLREKATGPQLRAMTAGVKAAEALAPTRPHPGVESATKHMLLGPPAAIMDRARDAIRAAMGKD
ncbi:hemerythrin [Acrocarpospora corrugata]|uniref:Hemerythrin n=1 Tax=Acrocarpospora corrugata TaxID=35763 RepID=A0A5M3W062_9ACTN|nr:hemerythrin domain-containing protein [Acrocarpospora corrugata]GES01422.1 hemerythrin [Acrocarpospora corrugata]